MSLLRSTLVMTALLALGATTAAAQSRVPASVWGRRLPDRDVRWESRNDDSDSDSDSERGSRRGGIFDRDDDSDSDGRARRGGVFDRRDRRDDRRDRSDSQRARDILLGRNTDRAHDEWHRRNDRDRRDRDWQRRHDELHDRLDRTRRQSGDRDRARRGDAGRASGRAGIIIPGND